MHENLQPLRIPPQWSLLWNHLRPIEPGDLAEDDPAWLFTFVQDMLYLRKNSDEQSVAIDLGWYPEGDPQGAYELVTILNDDWNNPLLAFTSRSTQEIVETMEHWLLERIPLSAPIDEPSFRKRYPNKR